MMRCEVVTRGGCAAISLVPGMELRIMASGETSAAEDLCTCAVRLAPGAGLPYHKHPCGEAITVLTGRAAVRVEGRCYLLDRFDCVHIPATVVHAVRNADDDEPAEFHTAFASAAPTREFVETQFVETDRDAADSSCPEFVLRFSSVPRYELAKGTSFCDLFGGRFGARGICGGYGLFEPGTGLPCHYHTFDESITIVSGTAVCQVAGREYCLADLDTASIPRGRPHRFLNRSDRPMEMIWVYAGDEPDRILVDTGLCDGGVPFPPATLPDLGQTDR